MYFQFVEKSWNDKTGRIPITNTGRASCPPDCLFYEDSCYAEAGYFTRLNWDKLDAGERGGSFEDLIDKIKNLDPGTLWRHNVAGDLPGWKNKIDRSMLDRLVEANTGLKGFTYTHKPVWQHAEAQNNLRAIRSANKNGFTINLSANNLQQALFYKAKFKLPVTAVVPDNHPTETQYFKVHRIPDKNDIKTGNIDIPAPVIKAITCPATYKENVNCKNCQLCQRADRDSIVLFPAHGARKKKANLIASDAA